LPFCSSIAHRHSGAGHTSPQEWSQVRLAKRIRNSPDVGDGDVSVRRSRRKPTAIRRVRVFPASRADSACAIMLQTMRLGDFLLGRRRIGIRSRTRHAPLSGFEGTVGKQDFLDNVRVAGNLFAHRPAQVNGPQTDPQALEHQTAVASIWLTPKSVGGFDADDFRELGPDRQRELADAVQIFLAVAQQVPPTALATAEQRAKASAAFVKILEILAPYLPTHAEAINIQRALATVEFPECVANWDYELDTDSDGAPAVWVTIFMDEQSAPRKQFGLIARDLTAKILRALSEAGIARWPYTQIRTAAEHKSMV
jgi:hypothetical protein